MKAPKKADKGEEDPDEADFKVRPILLPPSYPSPPLSGQAEGRRHQAQGKSLPLARTGRKERERRKALTKIREQEAQIRAGKGGPLGGSGIKKSGGK